MWIILIRVKLKWYIFTKKTWNKLNTKTLDINNKVNNKVISN